MAWNPSKEVAVARDAAKALGAVQAVVVFVTDGQFGYASYGNNKALCADAKKLGDKLFLATRDYFAGFAVVGADGKTVELMRPIEVYRREVDEMRGEINVLCAKRAVMDAALRKALSQRDCSEACEYYMTCLADPGTDDCVWYFLKRVSEEMPDAIQWLALGSDGVI